ncbi:uncharacterized protein DDB_G0290587 [Uranotaenia lowii]|uniref:uncharacterized protein DDB_G0290587 n=1 Tax=Uranotaenia lowii TaxID=190385 RepID=UPI00247AF9FA|nr:uncharacterized protein DDB_G0290587 [Uranotaenia lowii]XP_055597281.1 uncharacterized protein DDB_G0290587 [Uranotaenia lowii]XP_055597282.1 uncharacterized protein DDB_G0290587 [Uranotaenia lowii]XP_055597283.1 uncharacterized protein DDB_G0290587 [Uranotaenia lowii]XP_055597284.1 uncharacterized protein DDB_G0290587 [Uranotaenia lowii]
MSYGYSSGRTASQSSIYDYPEHLNPFYEDENHKRLRFWQFNRSSSGSGRRGSLVSLKDNIRDMWEFKTFRLKKKRASSLGINQTSESPPPLRRENADSYYNTVSSTSTGYRSTVGPGYTQSNTTTPQFQRNTRYRSSLQDQTKENGIGFNRNDRYRNTIQNGFATYSGGSMVTSTPRSKYSTNSRGMTAGVSQTSLKSSNPFEDDDLGDCVSLNDSSLSAGNGSIRTSMRTRKKRRAPPPPPVRHHVPNQPNGPSEEALLSTRLKIEESPPPENAEDVQQLSNLTAEIESFVRTTSDEDTNDKQNVSAETATSSDTNNNKLTETKLVIVENVSQTEKPPEEPKPEISEKVEEKQAIAPTESTTIPEPVESLSKIEELKIIEEPKNSVPNPPPRAVQPVPPVPRTPPIVVDVDFENLSLPETPIPARRNNRNKTLSKQSNANTSLRITEDCDNSLVTTETSIIEKPRAPKEEEENMNTKSVKPIDYEYQYKVEPIKTQIDEKIVTARLKINESTQSTEGLNTKTDAEDSRRSVRDIINSINKSQSLLKVNYETSAGMHSSQSNDSVNRNIRELNEREKEIQNMLREIDSRYGDRGQPSSSVSDFGQTKRGSYYDNVPDGDDNMNNLMSKGNFRVKKSPTKSLGMDNNGDEVAQFQDCHDWNPLPKPRRSVNGVQQMAGNGSVLKTIDQNNNGDPVQSK